MSYFDNLDRDIDLRVRRDNVLVELSATKTRLALLEQQLREIDRERGLDLVRAVKSNLARQSDGDLLTSKTKELRI